MALYPKLVLKKQAVRTSRSSNCTRGWFRQARFRLSEEDVGESRDSLTDRH